jgi:hypothetical protein
VTFEPTWSQPLVDWQQTGSYLEPASPPLLPPGQGTLVQLPCVNQDWLPLILGSLDQLRNPSSWLAALTDSQRSEVLARVDDLRGMVAMAIHVPCCNVQMRLTSDCKLQFSSDGGASYSDVAGWTTNIGGCVRANIPPPAPPNPNNNPLDQRACNLAGFLSQEIIQLTMQKMVAYVGTSNQQVAFAQSVLAALGDVFPITFAASIAFGDFYNLVVSQLLSEVNGAATDPSLWAAVTCAIFTHIRTVGYVDATNFAAVQAALHAISYPHAWVPNAIGNYWGDLGLGNIQAMQAVGALDDVDCTGCLATWCFEWDFTASNGGWAKYSTFDGVYTPGVGWASQPDSTGANSHDCVIFIDLPAAINITGFDIEFVETNTATAPVIRQLRSENPIGTSQYSFTVSNALTAGSCTPVGLDGVGPDGAKRLIIFWGGNTRTGQSIICKAHVRGNGINPLGLNNCTF